MTAIPIELLPAPPQGKTGWPWTEASTPLAPARPDGRAWPVISIVTPSYNQGAFLEETIRSVLLQNYPNLECIIIDGGSTDESRGIIEKYAPWLSYWVSEPDGGQAHAINKGLGKCTGDIFNWINSDDYLTPGALGTVARLYDEQNAVAGGVLNFGLGEEDLVLNRGLGARALIANAGASAKGCSFHQPGVWLSRARLIDCGGIDEEFHYVFDWDMAVRYFHKFREVVYTDAALVRFRLHPQSKSVSQAEKFERERWRICRKLMARPEYRDLHWSCSRRIRLVGWYLKIREILRQDGLSNWKKIADIAANIPSDPRIRMSRYTAGAIRSLLSTRGVHGEREV